MPRLGSPYRERGYLATRAWLARNPVRCVWCNWRRATSPDHDPPLQSHAHVEGSGCCRLLPSCVPCQSLQGGLLRWRRERIEADDPGEVVEPLGFDVLHPVWDVGWLDELRDVPEDATWPRFMTAPHPEAVGSHGEEIIAWARWQLGVELRWFQRLIIVRLAEHDVEGRFVWRRLVESMARRLGKSVGMRALFSWRLHHDWWFGEEQTILHTGRNMKVVKDVFRPALREAKLHRDVWAVREVNAQEEIELKATGSRWMLAAKDSVYGLGPSVAGVDEAWDVPAVAVDEGIEPTLLGRSQWWLLLISTAHRKATPLMLRARAQALSMLAAPTDRTLLIEWSAPRIMDVEDRGGWRLASPHWDEEREELIAAKVAAALSGMTDPDSDEPDPIEAVRTQWLNQWPLRLSPLSGTGEPLLREGSWSACPSAVGVVHQQLWVAVEDNAGNGAGVVAVALLDDGRLEVDGWLCESREVALRDARAVLGASPVPGSLLVGRSIPLPLGEEIDVARASAAEMRVGLPLLRSTLRAGRIVHDDAPDLEDQLATVRVREVVGGLAVISGPRSDLVRALSWALRAAVVGELVPSVHGA